MKQKIFFVALFIVGLSVGAFYFRDFIINQHPTLDGRVGIHLFILLIIAVAVQLLGHLLRASKSRYLINNIRPAKTSTLFEGLSVGYLFNTLLPLRIGEVIRAYYVGDSLYISKTAVLISIIIERIVDGLILGLCFISAGLIIKDAYLPGLTSLYHIGLGILILSLVLSLLIYALRSESKLILKAVYKFTSIFNETLSNRMRFIAWSGIYGTRLMLSDKKAMRKYLGLSIVMWMVYFTSTIIVALGFFHPLSPSKTWYVTQSTYAGVSAPAGPGYIGTFQLILTKLLHAISLGRAGAFAILMWIVLVAPISVIGLGVLIRKRANSQTDTPNEYLLINKLYREKDVSDELAHFLDAYFRGEKINQILTQAELENKFKLIKSFRGGSKAHTMLVWQNEEMRVKKITLIQYADKLESQAEWLSSRQQLPHLPRVVEEEKSNNYYYYDLAYQEAYFPLFDYIHSHSDSENFAVLKKVVGFLEKSIYVEKPVKDGLANLTSYIDEKIIGKVNDTATISNTINDLLAYKKVIINGASYLNLVEIVDKIKKNKKIMNDLAHYSESPIHGDLTIDNLIVSEDGDFLLLDPNNENQVSSKIVDFGKLYQSLNSGYEFLIQLDKCTVVNNKINFEDSKSHKYAELFHKLDVSFKKQLKTKDYNALLFHEAVHYCRLLTYRVSIDPETVPIFYATAVKLFNEFYGRYE